MSNLRKAAEMALEALETAISSHGVMLLSDPPIDAWKHKRVDEKLWGSIKALRQALAQQDKECVAIVNEGMGGIEWLSPCLPDDTPLYTAPPKREWVEQERAVGYREGHQAALKQREWVGLMDADIAETMRGNVEGSNMLPYSFARAIEAKLKEKNT